MLLLCIAGGQPLLRPNFSGRLLTAIASVNEDNQLYQFTALYVIVNDEFPFISGINVSLNSALATQINLTVKARVSVWVFTTRGLSLTQTNAF